MYLMGFLIKLHNAGVSNVTLLKIDSTTDTHLAILKPLGTLTDKIFPVNPGFMPDFHVNFPIIKFFNTNKDVMKLITKVWKIFKNMYIDEVYFSKAASLQCTGCNSTIKRLHHRFFSKYVLKTSYLKKNI